jgi:hypothetical protein
MKNLAGIKECDTYILVELAKADVPVSIVEQDHTEVPYTVTGKLGEFTFRRAWYYWVVNGRVPLGIAQKIYNNPNGVNDVRAGGNCSCPPPEKEAKWFDADGVQLIEDIDGEAERRWNEWVNTDPPLEVVPEYRFVPDPSVIPGAQAFVDCYHIDTQEGLNYFVSMIRGL